MTNINISSLGHTWIFDIDGTIVKHNGYLLDGVDTLLPGVKEFFSKLSIEDKVIFVTSRKLEEKDTTENFLKENEIRYDYIIFDMPVGERILINDRKPSGLNVAIAINTKRNEFLKDSFNIDESL